MKKSVLSWCLRHVASFSLQHAGSDVLFAASHVAVDHGVNQTAAVMHVVKFAHDVRKYVQVITTHKPRSSPDSLYFVQQIMRLLR